MQTAFTVTPMGTSASFSIWGVSIGFGGNYAISLSSITPPSVPINGGSISLSGLFWMSNSVKVRIGSIDAIGCRTISASQISCTAPQQTSGGHYSISIQLGNMTDYAIFQTMKLNYNNGIAGKIICKC